MKTIANSLTRLLAVAATAVAIAALVGAGNSNSHRSQSAPARKTSVHHPCEQMVRSTPQAPSDNSKCSPNKTVFV